MPWPHLWPLCNSPETHCIDTKPNWTPLAHYATKEITGVGTSSVKHLRIIFPTNICVPNCTMGFDIERMEYPRDFFIRPKSLFIWSVSFFSYVFPLNMPIRSTPWYGNRVIYWISMSVIGIGSPSKRHPSCTSVSNWHTQMVFMLVQLKCGTQSMFRSPVTPIPATHFIGSSRVTSESS